MREFKVGDVVGKTQSKLPVLPDGWELAELEKRSPKYGERILDRGRAMTWIGREGFGKRYYIIRGIEPKKECGKDCLNNGINCTCCTRHLSAADYYLPRAIEPEIVPMEISDMLALPLDTAFIHSDKDMIFYRPIFSTWKRDIILIDHQPLRFWTGYRLPTDPPETIRPLTKVKPQ